MIFRRIFRCTRDGIIGILRHLSMFFSASVAITITLLIIAVFGTLIQNLTHVVEHIQDGIKISVMVDYDYSDDDNINRIYNEIINMNGVVSAEHRTKEQEYEFYINSFHEEQKAVFTAYQDSNPFHENFLVSVDDTLKLDDISSKIQDIDGVYEVNYGGISTKMMTDFLDKTVKGGGTIVLGLCVLAIFLVYNTIRITISARSDEITIMRTIGASSAYIRFPFIVEGMIVGLFGSIIPILFLTFGYSKFYTQNNGILISGLFSLVEPNPFIQQLSLCLLGIGITVGVVGSYIGVLRCIRSKR